MGCDDMSKDERGDDVLQVPSGSGTQHNTQLSPLVPFICSCGNEANPIEHDGVYCSTVCAHHDTYEALVNGSSTSHYHRIQNERRSSTLSPPEFVEPTISEKGSVIAKTDALHDHAYMSIEEWASLDPVVEDAPSPSDVVDANLRKVGELAQSQRKARAARVRQPNKETTQPILRLNVDEKVLIPQFAAPSAFPISSPQSPPRRQRGRAVDNIRPVLNI